MNLNPRVQQFTLLVIRQLATLCLGVVLLYLAMLGLPDAAYQRAGPFGTEATLRALRSQLALDRNPYERFILYWKHLASGELRSIYTQEPLRGILPAKLEQTGYVLAASLIALTFFTAGWLVLFRFFHRAKALGFLVGVAASVPVFLTATLLMYVGTMVGISNSVGAGISLALFPSILVATNLDHRWNCLRQAKYHVLALHYRVPWRALFGRGVREFAPSVVLIGNAVAFYLVAGISIVELILGIPGLGSWMLESLLRVDIPVIFLTGVVVSVSASTVLLAANLVALWSDPRYTPRLAPS